MKNDEGGISKHPSPWMPQFNDQASKVGGRPAKPKAEKRSYKVVLSLTEGEGEKISSASGLAGDATYLYAKLKEHNII